MRGREPLAKLAHSSHRLLALSVACCLSFVQKALRLHPDTNRDLDTVQAEAAFKRLVEAFEHIKWEHEMRGGSGRSSYMGGGGGGGGGGAGGGFNGQQHMGEAEMRVRFKAPFDEQLGAKAFRAFLKNKEAVWERLNVEWDRQMEYDRRMRLDMELRAMEVQVRW
jgi:hypothetical protein